MKPKSKLLRFTDGIPVFFSYVILGSTWIAFAFGLSLHQTFSNRHQTARFLIQQLIGNGLFGLTIASLFTASTRGPGSPDRALAPSNIVRPTSPSSSADPEKARPEGPSSPYVPSSGANEDDIPLKLLRNANWVNGRVGKDRPSPLPLSHSGQSPFASQATGSDISSTSHPAFSPFPLNVSPFVPKSSYDAGGDSEMRYERRRANFAEGNLPRLRPLPEDNDDGVRETDRDRLLPNVNSSRQSIMAKSNTGEPRWCKKCDNWKPDRCHHCSYCRKCVLKMDHHCAWIGTCVGFDNYKPFWLFLTYSTVLSVYVAIEAGYETLRFFQDPDEFYRSPAGNGQAQCEVEQDCNSSSADMPEIDLAPVAFIGLAILGVFFTLAVGSLAAYHWWLASNNITTLENLTHSYPSVLLDAPYPTNTARTHNGNVLSGAAWKPDHLLTRDERNRLRREARDINIYDRGWKSNYKEVFGDRSIFLAFLPWVRAYHRFDREAGHFFTVEEHKLDRLRSLTEELRLSDNAQSSYHSESESSSEDENDGLLDPGFTPLTADSGMNGDDEEGEDGSSDDDDEGQAVRRGDNSQLNWFAA